MREYSTDNVINAMTVASDPSQRGPILSWALGVVEWADKHLSDYERSKIARIHQEGVLRERRA